MSFEGYKKKMKKNNYIIACILFLVVVSCNTEQKKRRSLRKAATQQPVISSRPVIRGLEYTGFYKVNYQDPEGDEVVFSILYQDKPGLFGISSDGWLHVLNNDLLEDGIFEIEVLCQEVNTPEQLTGQGTATVEVRLKNPLPNCDTIVMQLDSVYVPGYWQQDTTYLLISPSCWDTTIIQQ